MELNFFFRRWVKRYLLKLLEAKRIYWKQRSTIRWISFGDENTGVFQAYATQKYRRNHISQLKLEDDTVISEHSLKVATLWTSFKERLGQIEFEGISFDLSELIEPGILSYSW